MAEQTFTCDRCGSDFPTRQMKEAFIEEDGRRVKKRFDPQCLDEVMNAADEVRGIAGEDRRAAVAIERSGAADRDSLGRRP